MESEIDSARRALKAIKNGIHPAQADALALRLWNGPRNPTRFLAEIATEIIEKYQTPPIP
jgi:hypothetical protein